MDKNLNFKSFREFLSAVVAVADDGPLDMRLQYEAAATGQSEFGGGSAGGYLVPTEFAREIWQRVMTTGRILAKCDRQPVTIGDSLVVPVVSQSGGTSGQGTRFGGARMHWTDEAGTDTDSAVKIDALTFKLHKLLGLFYATDELVQDVPALAASLKRIFGLEASFAIERAIVSGDGIAKPLGVLNSDCLVKVTPEGGQATGSVVYPNIIKMVQRLWGPSHANAMWLMNAEIFGMLNGLASDTGEELFTVDAAGTRRMLSFPYEVCEYTSKTGVAGDLLLGDFTQYLLAEKETDGNLLSSIHIKYTTDESAFKLRYRVDGQPGWNAPIVPLNVADTSLTQSPFVALGARP